MVNID